MSFNKIIQYALKDYRKNIIYILFINILLATCFLLVLFFYAVQIDTEEIYNQISNQKYIQGKNIHFLNTFPNLNNYQWDNDNINTELYGAIYKDKDFVIVSSNKPFEFIKNIKFPIELNEAYTEPIVLSGNGVKAEKGTIIEYQSKNSLLKVKAKVIESIPKSTHIISKAGPIDLSDKKLLIIDTKNFLRYIQEPFLFWDNIRLSDNLDNKAILDLCNDLVENELCDYAYPMKASEVFENIASRNFGASLGLIFIIVYLIIIFFGLNVFLREVINKSMKTYAVHQIVGSSIKALRIRLLLFITFIMLPPITFLLIFVLPTLLKAGRFNLLPVLIIYLIFTLSAYLNNRRLINTNTLNKIIRNFSQ